jgi:hypothetical protein
VESSALDVGPPASKLDLGLEQYAKSFGYQLPCGYHELVHVTGRCSTVIHNEIRVLC